MSTAVKDFQTLNMPCDKIWYLGDAVSGNTIEVLEEVTRIQIDWLARLRTPLRYILGNHDFDCIRKRDELNEDEQPVVAFHEAVRNMNGWKTTDSINSMSFTEDLGDYAVFFLSDHGDSSGEWFTTHGKLHGDPNKYPYDEKAYLALREQMERCGKPVISVGHYAFCGGNRPSPLFDRFTPLPDNVHVHFYGHAHIGDKKYAKENCYRKVACVDYQKIPQINVSSLENRRGDETRSVIMEIYVDKSIGIYFRDHDRKKWAEAYFLNNLTVAKNL